MIKISGTLIVFFFLVSSCSKSKEDLILGKWSSSGITQESEALILHRITSFYDNKTMSSIPYSFITNQVKAMKACYLSHRFEFLSQDNFTHYYLSEREAFANMGKLLETGFLSDKIEKEEGTYVFTNNATTLTLKCFDKVINDWKTVNYKIISINEDSLIVKEQTGFFDATIIFIKRKD